jgi:protein-disulfide isomerase
MSRNSVTLIRRLASFATMIAVVAGGSLAGAVAPAEAAAKPVAVVNKVAPKITGKAEVGQTLSATMGTWTGSPKLSLYWAVCSVKNPTLKSGAGSCSRVQFATKSKYTVRKADSSRYLVVIVTAKVGAKVVYALSKSTAKVPFFVPKPANFTYDNGIRIGTGLKAFTADFTPTTADVPVVKIYLDYQCPNCKDFVENAGSQIDAMVASGQWIVEYHPLSFLDAESTNQYSTRAELAALCVANYNPDLFVAYSNLLWQNQPMIGEAGPTDVELLAFASTLGATSLDSITSCVNSKYFLNWKMDTNLSSLNQKIPGTSTVLIGTPTVVVGKTAFFIDTQDPVAFAAKVTQAWANR